MIFSKILKIYVLFWTFNYTSGHTTPTSAHTILIFFE